MIFTRFSQNTFFIEPFPVPDLSVLLESSVFLVFPFFNLCNVYLLVFCFTLHLCLFYLSSVNDLGMPYVLGINGIADLREGM